jgi:hypothetical protein
VVWWLENGHWPRKERMLPEEANDHTEGATKSYRGDAIGAMSIADVLGGEQREMTQ